MSQAGPHASSAVQVILQTALDGVVVADRAGRIRAANAAAAEMFGTTPDGLAGRTIGETIVPASLRAAHSAGMARYRESKVAHIVGQRIETIGARSDGSEFPVELAITEVVDGGETLFVSYLRDISDRLKSRAALEAARDGAVDAAAMKSSLMAMLSHDLRAPLSGMRKTLQLAQSAADPQEMARALDLAHRSAEQMQILVEDMLTFSQLEAGALEVRPEPVDLEDLAARLTEEWRPQFEAKGLEFVVDLNGERRRWLMLDPLRLRQIVDNLVSNALKFTDQGGVRITLRRGGERLSVAIEDTGCGLGDFDPAMAFTPFHRLKMSEKCGPGAGLGLWIVKSLVELHGGEVSLAPRSGGGARAAFAIPAPRAPKSATFAIRKKRLRGLSVLLVDDNETNRFVAEKMLNLLDCDVATASNGRVALDLAASRRFDVVLMDLDMPVMNGFEAIRRLRSGGPSSGALVLALTAYATRAHADRVVEAGADGLIAKPIQDLDRFARALLDPIDRALAVAPKAAAAAPVPPAIEDPSLLDLQAIRDLADALGPDEMQALAIKFAADVADGAAAVEKWAPNYNLEKIRRATHMLDAVAGTMGAYALQRDAQALNAACHGPDADAIEDLAPRLSRRATATLAAFERDWRSCLP